MSSNDACVVRKISDNCFEVRYVSCMDNDIPPDKLPIKATCNSLEEAMKIADDEYTEYGIVLIEDTTKNVSKHIDNDDEESDKKILQKTINDFNNHDETIECPYCGCEFLTERASLAYHNHLPNGKCVDEIYECEECGEYCQVVWRMESVKKLGNIIL